ncbi:MAG TPA: T9SS type A sorting domain-containing protein, partial [Bacteroidia bacterium]|nr:T9SS type A sorting domain-containing protein [Bacteroidia bacterium]
VIQQPLQVQYKWLASSMKIPVLEVDASVINSNEVVTGVTYQDSLRSNLFQVGVQDPAAGFARAGIFPNPAVDHTDVQLFSAQESEVDITLYDNSGRMVRNYGTRSLGSGETVITLDLSGLAAGIYKLQVAGRGQLYCGKIAICGG